MKHIASAILILLCLSAVAFGDGPMTAADPESLGFFSGGGGLVSTSSRLSTLLPNAAQRRKARRCTNFESSNRATDDHEFAAAGHPICPEYDRSDDGASWGLGFAIRTNPEASQVPGSVGTFTWGGLWGTTFWIDPAEKLIAVLMIQVAPSASGPYQSALRNLTYGALPRPRSATVRSTGTGCRRHGSARGICWQILFWTGNEFPRPAGAARRTGRSNCRRT